MFILRAPTDDDLGRYVARHRESPLTYPEVGAVFDAVSPRGYALDAYGCDLGHGEACFARARAALARFENYPRSFTRVLTDGGRAPEPGLTFVTHVRHLGFHSLNACRVLRVLDEDTPAPTYGFSLGTTTGHEECGEELFRVQLDPTTRVVRYDVRAFSRPGSLLARLGAPVARSLQRRFHRETCEAMQAVVRRPKADRGD